METIYNISTSNHTIPMHSDSDSTSSTIYNPSYYLSLVTSYCIILSVLIVHGYFIHANTYFYLFVVAGPLCMVTYNAWFHITSSQTSSELVNQINYEINTNQTTNIIPLLIFSMSIILHYIRPKQVKHAIIYMLWAVIFGSILTGLLKQLVFNHKDVSRLIFFSETEFTLIYIAVGFILLSISVILEF